MSSSKPPSTRVVHREFVPGQGLVFASPAPPPPEPPRMPSPPPHHFQQPSHHQHAPVEPLRVKSLASSILLPSDLRQYFMMQTQILTASVDADDPMLKELPIKFQSIFPLESTSYSAGSSGYHSRVYKCLNIHDGFVYAVRRVDNARISSNLHYILSMWKKVSNPNLVPLHELFYQNKSLFLVHEFYPGAQTLENLILTRQHVLLPESIIWSILLQVLSAIRAVHAGGLACRDLNVSKILMTGKYRARVACAGLVHALEPSTTLFPLAEQQSEDMYAVGRLALCLVTMSIITSTVIDVSSTMSIMMNHGYSHELIQFVLHPFRDPACTSMDLVGLCSSALMGELDNLYTHTDSLEDNLFKAYDCDRMFRIQLKLSMICERPSSSGNGHRTVLDSWSETGDRYVIKLFRDYVFHQVDEVGNAVVDFGHIIECLNKLDCGSMEQILLASRDGKTFVVVTYEDVRRCVEASFHSLFPE
ncbi:hypothetical protein BASA81_002924 [Batrachochytrium salamandrivorans]|nr:hypothetical protein BASA81_002924 [Batrachochytrium salamandrivorans]